MLPTILPTEISESPFIAAVALIISSGSDVPIDTIVSPIIISGILNFLANVHEPSTKKSAPFANKNKPKYYQ